jgi:large subunit ribosomal protein L3
VPRVRSPKRGSKAFSPRKRAKNINGRIDYWPKTSGKPHLLGFAGYKAGMTHIFTIEDRKRSPDFGKEIKNAVTILETPPMNIIGIRAYKKTYDGLKVLTEAWVKEAPVDLYRRIKTFGGDGPEKGFKIMEEKLDKIVELRAIASTQPKMAAVSKKKPDVMEISIGGSSIKDQLEYATGFLGKNVRISDIFSVGESIDIIGVTVGKGFQGPVKRWGVRILQNKSRKTVRGVASIGSVSPRWVHWSVPRAGQMGLHGRTEYNKRIFMIGSDGERMTPKGGLKRYGEIKSEYVLLKGSVMGPVKRLIKLRKGVRASFYQEEVPQITYLHTEFNNRMED